MAGLRAAHSSGNRAVGANILGFMSEQARDRDPRDAVWLAESALVGAKDLTPAVGSWIQARLARGSIRHFLAIARAGSRDWHWLGCASVSWTVRVELPTKRVDCCDSSTRSICGPGWVSSAKPFNRTPPPRRSRTSTPSSATWSAPHRSDLHSDRQRHAQLRPIEGIPSDIHEPGCQASPAQCYPVCAKHHTGVQARPLWTVRLARRGASRDAALASRDGVLPAVPGGELH
jgi:hypothetical protein